MRYGRIFLTLTLLLLLTPQSGDTVSFTSAGNVKFTSAAKTLTVNTPSSTSYTVEVKDALGGLVNGAGVSLSSTSTGGRFDTSSGGAFSGSVTSVHTVNGIATFYYKDSVAGSPNITVSASKEEICPDPEEICSPISFGSASQTQTVISLNPATQIAFVGSTHTFAPGIDPNPYTVETRDASNQKTNDNVTLTLVSSSATGKFDTSAAGAFNGTVTSIQTINGTGVFYYKDTTVGTPTITVSKSGLTSATQQQTVQTPVGSATQIVFTSTAQALTPGQASNAYTVEIRDAANQKTYDNFTLILSSTSATGQFSASLTPFTPVGTIVTTSGAGTFYYKDSTKGTPTITVSKTGLTSATQVQTVGTLGEVKIFRSPIVFVKDGDYTFNDYSDLGGCTVDGRGWLLAGNAARNYISKQIDLSAAPYNMLDPVQSLVVNWKTEGRIDLQVTVNDGVSPTWTSVHNGVPILLSSSASGRKLKWKAALTASSKLKAVNIAYSEAETVNTFGSKDLSKFKYRRKLTFNNSQTNPIYNYPRRILVGESKNALGEEVYCGPDAGGTGLANTPKIMQDVRFTAADGVTPLGYFLHPFATDSLNPTPSVFSNRTTDFWVNISEVLQAAVTPIWIYYGAEANTKTTSNYNEVFAVNDPADIVVGQDRGQADEMKEILALLNSGTGSFTRGFNTAIGTQSTDDVEALAVGDVDLDGDLDMVVAEKTSPQVYALLNQGNGEFLAAQNLSLFIPTNATSLRDAALADIDNDGDLDLLVLHHVYINSSNYGGIRVWLNNQGRGIGSNTFIPHPTQPLINVTEASHLDADFLEVADFTGDGNPDIIAEAGSSYFSKLWQCTNSGFPNYTFNCGSSSILGPTEILGDNTKLGAAGDFDNDKDVDLLVFIDDFGNTYGFNNRVVLLKNKGGGNFVPTLEAHTLVWKPAGGNYTFLEPPGYIIGLYPECVALNGSGYLVRSNSCRTPAAGTFQSGPVAVNKTPFKITTNWVEVNSISESVSVDNGQHYLTASENKVIYDFDASPESDADKNKIRWKVSLTANDILQEVRVTYYYADNIIPVAEWLPDDNYSALTAGDFNGDGLLDFALARPKNTKWAEMYIYLNQGNDTFAFSTSFEVSNDSDYNITHLAAADLRSKPVFATEPVTFASPGGVGIEESVKPAEFSDSVIVAPNGDIALAEGQASGWYRSQRLDFANKVYGVSLKPIWKQGGTTAEVYVSTLAEPGADITNNTNWRRVNISEYDKALFIGTSLDGTGDKYLHWKVKLTSASDSLQEMKTRIFFGRPYFSTTTPASLPAGSNYDIKWKSKGKVNNINLSYFNGSTWVPIATNLANTSTEIQEQIKTWQVAGCSGNIKLKIEDAANPGYVYDESGNITITPKATQLVFTAKPVSMGAGGWSTAFTLERRDACGNSTTRDASGNIALLAVALSSDSAALDKKFKKTNGSIIDNTTNPLNIPQNSATVDFFYYDTVVGNPKITAASTGVTSAEANIPVEVGDANKLIFTTKPTSIPVGARAKFTVQRQDTYGNPTKFNPPTHIDASLTANLSVTGSTTGKFYTDLTSTTNITSITILQGTNQVDFYYYDTTMATNLTVIATSAISGITAANAANLPVEAGDASKLVYTVKPTSLMVGSRAKFTVQRQDAGGNPTKYNPGRADASLTVNLAVTGSTTGKFYETLTSATNITNIIIPQGANQIDFYYSDTTIATNLTVNATSAVGGITAASASNISVEAGDASKLVYTVKPTSITLNTRTKFTVQRQDAGGNPTKYNPPSHNDASLTANLSVTGSATGKFYPDLSSTTNITSVTIPQGANQVDFYYYDTTVATGLTITATSTLTGITSATATSLVVEPGSADKLVYTVKPSTIPAGTRTKFTVQRQDVGNNPTNFNPPNHTNDPLTANLSVTGSSTGKFYPDLTSTTNITSVIIPQGANQIDFYYYDTTIATGLTVTATSAISGITAANAANLPVEAGDAKKIVLTVKPTTIIAGIRAKYTVQRQDVANNPTKYNPPNHANASLTVDLALTGSSTGKFYPDLTSTTNIQSIVIPQGADKIDFYYYDTTVVDINHALSITVSTALSGITGEGLYSIIVEPGDANKLAYTVKPTTIAAGIRTKFTVQRQDAFNNPTKFNPPNHANASLTVNLTVAGSSTGKFYPDLTSTTNIQSVTIPQGADKIDFYYYDTTVATGLTVTATSAITGITQISASNLSVEPGDANKLAYTVKPTTIAAGTRTKFTVQRQDASNNPTKFNPPTHIDASLTANLSVTGSSTGKFYADLSNPTNITSVIIPQGADKIDFYYYDTKSADAAHAITVNANSAVAGVAAAAASNLTVQPKAAAKFKITGPATLAAGSNTNNSITISALDEFNNPVSFGANVYSGIKTLIFSGAAAAPNGVDRPQVVDRNTAYQNFGLPTELNFANGAVTTPLKLYKVEAANIVATEGSITTSGADRLTISVTPGSVNSFVVASPEQLTAGTAFEITITANDAFGNIKTDYAGQVSFISSDQNPDVILPTPYTFNVNTDQGVHTFSGITLVSSGVQTVTIKDIAANVSATSEGVEIKAGDLDFFGFEDLPVDATAGAPFNLTITAQDRFGNTKTDYAGLVSFTSSDQSPEAALPNPYRFNAETDQGSHSFSGFTLVSTGTQTITAEDTTANISTASDEINVKVGALDSFAISGLPASVAAGVPFNLTVTAKDRFGNTKTDYDGTVAFTSTDEHTEIVLPSPYNFNPGIDQGTHLFQGLILVTTPGPQTITVKDNVANILQTSEDIVITAGEIDHYVVTPTDTDRIKKAGEGWQETITAYDRFNNLVTGVSGAVVTLSTKILPNRTTSAQFYTDNSYATLQPGSQYNLDASGTTDIFIKDTKAEGPFKIIARDANNKTGTSIGAITIKATEPNKLLFIPKPPVSISVGAVQKFTVQRQDAFGNQTNLNADGNPGTLDVNLNVVGSITGKFLVSSDPQAATINKITILEDAYSADFYYYDETAGAVTIRGSNQRVPNPAEAAGLIIKSEALNKLVFKEPIASTVTAGVRTKYIVERRDKFDNPIATGNLIVNVNTSNTNGTGKFYVVDTHGNYQEVSQITIADTQSEASVYYYDTTPGRYNLTVQSGNISGSCAINVLEYGITITEPADDIWVADGTAKAIKWESMGLASNVEVWWSKDGGANFIKLPDPDPSDGQGIPSPDGEVHSYTWQIPDDLGSNSNDRLNDVQFKVRTIDGVAEAVGHVGIRPKFEIIQPAPGLFLQVGSKPTIKWHSDRGHNGVVAKDVRIDLLYNGNAWQNIVEATPNNGNYTPADWVVPDEITANAKIRISDADVNHVQVFPGQYDSAYNADAAEVKIAGVLGIDTPTGEWIALEADKPDDASRRRTLTWHATGSIGKVKISFAVPKDNYTEWYEFLSDVDSGGSGTAAVTSAPYSLPAVPDAVAKAFADFTSRNKLSTKVKFKIEPMVEGRAIPAVTEVNDNSVSIKYYQVEWKVRDSDSLGDLSGLNVSENRAGEITWLDERGVLNSAAGIFRNYSFGSYATTWQGRAGDYSSPYTNNWTADKDQIGRDAKIVYLESAAAQKVDYEAKVGYVYDPKSKKVSFKTWLERKGILVEGKKDESGNELQLLGARLDVFDGDTLLKTLSTSDAGQDSLYHQGTFGLNWDTSQLSTPLDPTKNYFVKATIHYFGGKDYVSGGTFQISTEEKLQEIKTQGETLRTEVIPELVSTIGTKIETARRELAGKVTEAQTAVQQDVAAVKADTSKVLVATETTIPSQITTTQMALEEGMAEKTTQIKQIVESKAQEVAQEMAKQLPQLEEIKGEISNLYSQFTIIQSALNRIEKEMPTGIASGAVSPVQLENIDAIYQQLGSLSKQVRRISFVKGAEIEKLLQVEKSKGLDLLYLKNKTQELKALMEVSQRLIDNVANAPVIHSWYEFGTRR